MVHQYKKEPDLVVEVLDIQYQVDIVDKEDLQESIVDMEEA